MRYLSEFIRFLHLLSKSSYLILAMAKREIISQYVGSVLGLLWTFIHPAVTILVFWAVFGLAFNAQPQGGVPYVIWLTCGISAWFLLSESITGAVRVINAYAMVIKKTPFQSQILPVVRLLTCFVNHAIYLLLLLLVMLAYHQPLLFSTVQFLYYFLCTCALALGLGWLVAALNPFAPDVAQIVNVAMQLGFWITPITWDLSMMPERYRVFFRFNPANYLVQGYRDSFLYSTPFWDRPAETTVFWAVALGCMFLGGSMFKKLKPHFADVL